MQRIVMVLAVLVVLACAAGAWAGAVEELRSRYPWIYLAGPGDYDKVKGGIGADASGLLTIDEGVARLFLVGLDRAYMPAKGAITAVGYGKATDKARTCGVVADTMIESGVIIVLDNAPPQIFPGRVAHEAAHAYTNLLNFMARGGDSRRWKMQPTPEKWNWPGPENTVEAMATRARWRYKLDYFPTDGDAIKKLWEGVHQSAVNANVINLSYRPPGAGGRTSTRSSVTQNCTYYAPPSPAEERRLDQAAIASGFARDYGRTNYTEDISSYVDRLLYPEENGPLAFCSDLPGVRSGSGKVPGNLAVALAKLRLLRGLGYITQQAYDECAGKPDAFASPAPGIFLGVTPSRTWKSFKDRVNATWTKWPSRLFFLMETDGLIRFDITNPSGAEMPFNLQVLLDDPSDLLSVSNQQGFYKLAPSNPYLSPPISTVRYRLVMCNWKAQLPHPNCMRKAPAADPYMFTQYSQSGWVLVSDVTSNESGKLVGVRGAIGELVLENLALRTKTAPLRLSTFQSGDPDALSIPVTR